MSLSMGSCSHGLPVEVRCRLCAAEGFTSNVLSILDHIGDPMRTGCEKCGSIFEVCFGDGCPGMAGLQAWFLAAPVASQGRAVPNERPAQDVQSPFHGLNDTATSEQNHER